MQHTNIFGYKILYHKYIVASAGIGYATRRLYASLGSRTEGVKINNQRDEDQGILSSEEGLTIPVKYSPSRC